GAVAEQREGLFVVRVDDAGSSVRANDKRKIAAAGRDELCASDECVHKTGARGGNVESSTADAELVLDLASSRGNWQIGRERAQHNEVNLAGRDASACNC